MTRAALLALLLAAAGSVAEAQAQGGPRLSSANPSAVIAAELAFNRLAQEKGQWTAFRATATKDAVMFAPGQVVAQTWLKGRKDPAKSVKWQPHKVFMSCDGAIGISTGAWQQPDGTTGYFTTVWQRQKKGDYKWLFDHGDALATPREAGDMIAAKIATCPRGRPAPAARPGAAPVAPTPGQFPGRGQSPDETLRWSWTVQPDLSRTLTVSMRQGDDMAVVLTDDVKAARP